MSLPLAYETGEAGEVPRTSQILIDAVREQDDRVTVAELAQALHGRAFGMASLIFALPACVPMPPGVPTVVGLAILLVSLQLAMGRTDLWLPRFIANRSFSREWLLGALEKTRPRLEQVERFAQPRLLFLTGPVGSRLVGLVLLILAVMLILPIPIFGNMPLAFAAAILSVALIERDGRLVLFGVHATVIAIAIVTSVAFAAIWGFKFVF
jgi:hypothetical protein